MILYKLGEKYTLILGGVMYLVYVASNALFSKFQEKLAPLLLICAGMNGFGAAVIWTAQGSYLSRNSTNKTMGRNNGIVSFFTYSLRRSNSTNSFTVYSKSIKQQETY